MKNVKTILAALDLEAGSDAVLTRAIQLATAHAARLVLLHIIEGEALLPAASVPGRRANELRIRLKRQARATIEPLVIQSGRTRRTTVQVEFGSPHDVITRIAEKRHAEVILVGPGKGRSFREKVLGSTTDRVIRTARKSVLIVKRQSDQPYRRVAVAVDFSPQSATAVQEARKLAPHAGLQFIHAVEIPLSFQQAMLRAGNPETDIQKFMAARADQAHDDFSAFVRSVLGADKAVTRVLQGEPGPVLVRVSKASSVELLAVGPHGRGVVRQALLGSVTLRVLKESKTDILVAIQPQ